MRPLLVNRNDIFEGSLKRHLSDGGFRYDDVPTLAAGIETVEAAHCAVLTIDIRLPDGDGCTLVANVRAKEDEAPIVMLTHPPGQVRRSYRPTEY